MDTSVAQKQALINFRVLLYEGHYWRDRLALNPKTRHRDLYNQLALDCERDARAELARAKGG